MRLIESSRTRWQRRGSCGSGLGVSSEEEPMRLYVLGTVRTATLTTTAAMLLMWGVVAAANAGDSLDDQLTQVLGQAGFTGEIESKLTQRLGRPLNPQLANLGRLLFFDKSGGLHDDNTCAGCHAPT